MRLLTRRCGVVEEVVVLSIDGAAVVLVQESASARPLGVWKWRESWVREKDGGGV
jgi:hypothetical protein